MISKAENYFREHFGDPHFPMSTFTAEINTVSIDFLREAANYIDIKRVLWNARPWEVEESIEQHMNYWHGHLKEFWKDILTDEEYVNEPAVPVKLKSVKQILSWIK